MMLFAKLTSISCGNELHSFWRLFYRREKAKALLTRRFLAFLVNVSARRHGGYIGNGAKIAGVPTMPHGLHGVYISRYACIGADCCIYQNVTIGEVDRKAPRIGNRCLIGANACVIGDITIGDDVKIGAGAVVACDVPGGSTVVAQAPRMIVKAGRNGWKI